jgi:acetyl-CoA acetyltransferase
MQDIVIVAAARTAVGRFGGTLAKTPATELGAAVISALLARSGVSPELAARIAARAPRVPGRPTDELRGPHDNWFTPPLGPRRT